MVLKGLALFVVIALAASCLILGCDAQRDSRGQDFLEAELAIVKSRIPFPSETRFLSRSGDIGSGSETFVAVVPNDPQETLELAQKGLMNAMYSLDACFEVFFVDGEGEANESTLSVAYVKDNVRAVVLVFEHPSEGSTLDVTLTLSNRTASPTPCKTAAARMKPSSTFTHAGAAW